MQSLNNLGIVHSQAMMTACVIRLDTRAQSFYEGDDIWAALESQGDVSGSCEAEQGEFLGRPSFRFGILGRT